MEVNKRLLGKQIREIRQQKGISQEELAYLADVTPQYISIVENGAKLVSLTVLINIAEGLGVSVDEILIGNQKYDGQGYAIAIMKLFSECTRYEKQVLYEQLHSSMLILKNNRNLIEWDK